MTPVAPLTTAALADLIARGETPRLLDVRWQLGDPAGREKYLAGHLPGAVYVDLDTELAAPASPAAGRHPLPSVEDLQESARRWGLTTGDRVVVYDAVGGTAAARAWWLLTWAGVQDVTLLDGGYPAWVAEGRPVETGEYVASPGNVTLTPGALPVIETPAQAQSWADHGQLVDVRAAERYRGETEPIDPRAGHIPGARNVPTGTHLDADSRLRSPSAIREAVLGSADVEPVGVYCGSGVTAAHTVFALATAAVPAALYPGSWSQWSNDPTLPVETGGA